MYTEPDRFPLPHSIDDIIRQAVDAALRWATIHHYAGIAGADEDDSPALLVDTMLTDFEEVLTGPAGCEIIEALRREAGRKMAGLEAPPEERGVVPRSPRRIEFFAALVKTIARRYPESA